MREKSKEAICNFIGGLVVISITISFLIGLILGVVWLTLIAIKDRQLQRDLNMKDTRLLIDEQRDIRRRDM